MPLPPSPPAATTTPKSCCLHPRAARSRSARSLPRPEAHRVGRLRASSRPSTATGAGRSASSCIRAVRSGRETPHRAAGLLPGAEPSGDLADPRIVPHGERAPARDRGSGAGPAAGRGLAARSTEARGGCPLDSRDRRGDPARPRARGRAPGPGLRDISIRDDGHAIMTEPARVAVRDRGTARDLRQRTSAAARVVNGRHRRGDRRSVVYSLGVISTGS